MVRMPPPNCVGTSTALRISCTAARLTGWPSTAPLRSTRCSHSQPAWAKALAWAAGLSLNTVARAMSPRSRRTHLPSFKSMAGNRIMGRGFSASQGRAPPSLVASGIPSSLSRQSTAGVRFSRLMAVAARQKVPLTKFGGVRESGKHRMERGTARFLAVAKAADGFRSVSRTRLRRDAAPSLERGMLTGNRCRNSMRMVYAHRPDVPRGWW